MHRFFNTRELLDLTVRRVSEKKTLYAFAQTCHLLKDPALDVLWANLDSIAPLLLLLRPLKLHGQWSSDSKRWVFDNTPGAPMLTLSEWDVFLKYNYRVRKLLFNPESVSIGQSAPFEVSLSVFNELAVTRPPDCPLLPNLRTLKVIANIPSFLHLNSIIFCHSGIQHLHVEYNITQPAVVQHTFQEMVSRTPNITVLTFGCVLPIETVQNIVPFISKLKNLKEVVLPRGYVTTAMLGALGHSQDLKKISAYKDFTHRPQRIQTLPNTNTIEITPGAFQRITKLSLFAPLETLTKVVEVDWANELKEMELAIESSPGDNGDISGLLGTLARSRSNLLSLRLDNSWNSDSTNAVTFDTLSPLMRFGNIRALVIRHPAGLILDEVELTQLLSCWPNLAHLNLCADPFRFGPRLARAGIPWELLGLFSTCCPKIQHLGFPFSSNSPLHDLGGQWRPLERLKSINVGLSDVSEPFDLACFLAKVCNSHIVLHASEYGSLISHDLIPAEESQRREKWRQTEKMARHMAAIRERINLEKDSEIRELKRQLTQLSLKS